MRVSDFLRENRPRILKAWIEAAVATYPSGETRFLATQKDPLANPVGHALSEGLSGLIEHLAQGSGPESMRPFLDGLMRVRAVQAFAPSSAVGFLFSLKGILREMPCWEESAQESRQLDDRIDALVLEAFDSYLSCREKIHEIRLNEVRNLAGSVRRRME